MPNSECAPASVTALPEAGDAERARARFQAALDPYVDPDWAILKNKVHARTQGELDTSEVALVLVRTLELVEQPVQGLFDLSHLQAIHQHLFQDVYPFAGELRTVDIRKADDPSGGFMPVSRLLDAATYVFSELKAENYLRALATEPYVGRLGHYLDEVNHLHPFREGNGRTQRIFFSQLAGGAGHTIDWTQLTVELNNSASKAGEAALIDMLRPIVSASTEPTYEATAANLLRAGNAFSNPLDRSSPRTATPTRHEPPSAGAGPSMRR